MGKWDGLNRRRFPRVNFPCLVVIKQKDSEDIKTVLSHTENVGVGGLCLNLKQNVKLFTEVDVEIDLMDAKDHIKAKGKVVWNVRRKQDANDKPLFYDIGVEFENLKPQDKARIEGVLEKLVKEKKDKSYIV